MSNKVAIILAAGYKAIGWNQPGVPPVCPEALLPIGEGFGHTPVARLAAQLKHLEYQSFIAVGRPGCRYTGFLKKCVVNPTSELPAEAMAEVDQAPWTYERLQYVAQCGVPLLMPEPDMKAYDDSAMRAIDLIGTDWWDKLVILQCDYVWSLGGLQDTLSQEAPCQVLVPGHHVIVEVLTPVAAQMYRQFGDRYRHREKWGWTLEMGRWGEDGLPPEGRKFQRLAPYHFLEDTSACSKDLDVPADYKNLLEHWLPRYG